ncbi:hypothetical protein Tco_0232725 [Tanacetum coccineum]
MAEIGCNWARIGPSKSSQSLSIAHKWAVGIPLYSSVPARLPSRVFCLFTLVMYLCNYFLKLSDERINTNRRLHSNAAYEQAQGTRDRFATVLSVRIAYITACSKYEAEKERQLKRNVQSKRSPIKYEGADLNSFHQDKHKAFDYPNYHENFEIDKYHGLPPLHPCFQSAQPYTKDGLVSSNKIDEVRMSVENLIGMKQEEAKVEDYDEGDIYDIWDITVEDVQRLRQLLTPTIHTFPEPNPVDPDVNDDLIQPLIPQPTPPDDAYVVTDANPTLDELLEEFIDEILDITVVDEEDDFNPTRDIEELERLITDHESYFYRDKAKSWMLVVILACDYVKKSSADYSNYGVVIVTMA